MIAALICLTLTWAEGDQSVAVTNACALGPIQRKTRSTPESEELWQLTLGDAVRITFNNSETIRVISLGPQGIPVANCFGPFEPPKVVHEVNPDKDSSRIIIARIAPEMTLWRFKAEVMALVRTTEQQYWNLAHKHALLWSTSKAIELTEEVLKAEKKELGHGAIADIAEAEQRLDQFQRDLVTAKSDVIVAERQLRNTLGLPPVDSRQIIPVTHPRKERAELCWNECVGLMSAHQPDIVRQGEKVRQAEWLSRNVAHILSGFDPGNPVDSELVASVEKQLKHQTARQQELWEQVAQQAGRSLGRCFQEVDANDKLWQAASRLRATSEKRLKVQRVFYEEGRIPIDRYLDAISADCTAKVQEAQAKAAYSLSLTMLEEAKGTLLTTLGIEVRETLRPRCDSDWDSAVRTASLELELVPVATIPDTTKAKPQSSVK